VVGLDQDCDHKEKRDGQFGEKGGKIAVSARQGRGIANRFVRGCALQCECCQRDAGNRAEELPGSVEHRIRRRNFCTNDKT
jgi:hypothetical protein